MTKKDKCKHLIQYTFIKTGQIDTAKNTLFTIKEYHYLKCRGCKKILKSEIVFK